MVQNRCTANQHEVQGFTLSMFSFSYYTVICFPTCHSNPQIDCLAHSTLWTVPVRALKLVVETSPLCQESPSERPLVWFNHHTRLKHYSALTIIRFLEDTNFKNYSFTLNELSMQWKKINYWCLWTSGIDVVATLTRTSWQFHSREWRCWWLPRSKAQQL